MVCFSSLEKYDLIVLAGLGWRADNRRRGFETGGAPGRRDEGIYSDVGS